MMRPIVRACHDGVRPSVALSSCLTRIRGTFNSRMKFLAQCGVPLVRKPRTHKKTPPLFPSFRTHHHLLRHHHAFPDGSEAGADLLGRPPPRIHAHALVSTLGTDSDHAQYAWLQVFERDSCRYSCALPRAADVEGSAVFSPRLCSSGYRVEARLVHRPYIPKLIRGAPSHSSGS